MRRRRALASVVCLAWAGGDLRAAGPALPQRNLAVEARVVEQTESERQALAGAGSVVLDSRGATSAQGGLTVRAGSEQAQSRQLQRVLVLNGGRATLRLSQLTPLRTLELAWSGITAGVSERTRWVDVGRGLTVQPRWPGGRAPVLLELQIDSVPAGHGAADVTAERTQLQTQLSLPLGEWVTVAELSEASAVPGTVTSSARVAARSLQLRVTAP